MPVQRTVLGRPVPLRLQTPPKRFLVVIGVSLFIVAVLLVGILTPPRISSAPPPHRQSKPLRVGSGDKIVQHDMPKLYNPIGSIQTPPPVQVNSTLDGVKWHLDLHWLNAFSSLITLDDDRVVIPPIIKPPIYTYYAGPSSKDPAVAEADQALLLTWRRMWWSWGFRPIVIGPDEAKQHILYEPSRSFGLKPKVLAEYDRWLAWNYMGGGVLCDWLVYPFTRFLDPTFFVMRFGLYGKLTRWTAVDHGFFVAQNENITAALQHVANNLDQTRQAKTMIEALKDLEWSLEEKKTTFNYYSMDVIEQKYKPIANKWKKSEAKGKRYLNKLINAHLHWLWEQNFNDGICILTPLRQNMDVMTLKARKIAMTLAACPKSPLPSACPPTKERCEPCDPDPLNKIRLSPSFVNITNKFQIGITPHPLTFNALRYDREWLEPGFIRRTAERDYWIQAVTDHLMGYELSGQQRLMRFKWAVAGYLNSPHALWLTAESGDFDLEELEWIVGFQLPRIEFDDDELLQPAGRKEADLYAPQERPPTQSRFIREKNLMQKSIRSLETRGTQIESQQEIGLLEAWNMADVEAWRFVRAWDLKRRLDRKQWEYEERNLTGLAKNGGGKGEWEAWVRGKTGDD